jgi:hypothetical protein
MTTVAMFTATAARRRCRRRRRRRRRSHPERRCPACRLRLRARLEGRCVHSDVSATTHPHFETISKVVRFALGRTFCRVAHTCATIHAAGSLAAYCAHDSVSAPVPRALEGALSFRSPRGTVPPLGSHSDNQFLRGWEVAVSVGWEVAVSVGAVICVCCANNNTIY